ncbi:MAG: hypothetical protein FJ247_09665 [Nitrospira sp.]|nr:hypothetical protein [Nitrospira sp.]
MQPRLHRIFLVSALLAYLALALPLPFVLLDHEWGILTGDPTHSVHDDHAWFDHAAGAGLASCEAEVVPVDVAVSFVLSPPLYFESSTVLTPSVRGPPVPFF